MDSFVRVLIRALRWSLGLCALVLVLAALYVSLGRELVPLVAEYRAEVESRASEAIGRPLGIGSLEGRWHGFSPLLIAHDVMLGDDEGALRLDQVRVIPDVLGSLLARQPRIARIELEGLQLGVRQDAAGQWHLEGFTAKSDTPLPGPRQVRELLQRIGQVSVLNSQLTLEPHAQAPLTFAYVNLSLRTGITRQRLDGRLNLPDGQPMALRLRSRLNAETWFKSEAEVYLSLPQTDWARWLPSGLAPDWRLQRLQAGGEFWGEWADGLQRVALRLHAPELKGAYATRKPVTLQDLALNAYFIRQPDGYQMLVDSLAADIGAQRWGDIRLRLDRKAGEQPEWRLGADRLDLAPLLPVVEALVPLPEAAAEAVAALKPRGALRNINLVYRPAESGPGRLTYGANLNDVGFEAYHGAPAVENVSGSLTGDLARGELRLDSRDFALHLDHLFPKPWRYREARARLTWALDDSAFTLASPYMRLKGEEGSIAGDMLIRLMRDPAAEDYMDLRVGLTEGDARYTEKYLPTRSPGLSPALATWLKEAIRGGAVDEGFFQYQGSLAHGADPGARSLSLFFKVHDAELAYQPGWPELREARGDVFIEDSGVRIEVPAGRILDSRVSDARAEVPHVEPGAVPRLLLDAQLQSNFVDGLKILREAPMGTAQIFEGWQGEGALDGRLKLDIPLEKGHAPQVVVDLATTGAQLKIPRPELAFSQLRGAFRYDTAKGLSAQDLRGQAFGREVRVRALAEGRNGQARSRILATGAIALKDLTAWLGVTQALPASGTLPYSLNLSLDGQDSQLRVDSSLRGLALDLPAPFGKAADDTRDTTWRMTLEGDERRYWLDYAGVASLVLAAPVGKLDQARGDLVLGGGTASLPGSPGLRVRGRLDELEASPWQKLAARYAPSESTEKARMLRSVDLDIARFWGFGLDMENLKVSLERAPAAWSLGLDSALVTGKVVLADAEGSPISVQLKQVRLPKPPESEVEADARPDPLAGVDPRSVPALDVRIDQVVLGDSPLGAWSFKARPNARGLLFSDLDLDLRGLKVTGSAGWEGTAESSASWYKGRLEGRNLADVLTAWNFAPSATSERFRLDADGRWPGSPAWVSLKRYSGSLDASLSKGQFVEVEGGAQALRVFGLLNFNSIGRRLRLDFSDLLGKGLAYDRVRGLLVGSEGRFVTRNPIVLEGPSSGLELDGTLDLASDRIDAKLLVTLPVTNNLPLAALIVGAPAIGGALFVVDKLLGDRVARFASVQYRVEGSWKSPKITFDKPFEKPR
ncbi:YhdP family protein [Metapseudomonas furukawaii]|uniref:Possible exported protein n=1 Tax=Metapseudomonas furukawaii TaxID=1149133 RepID=A0AAD1BVP4_METFU|nr:Putative exported protein [Pseudomonas furukawaii]BAU72634.1 possible exported protein [Pseudomonas furukawaii]